MLVIIRQPLGAAALISLLGSGLWGAEFLACAQIQAQLTGQIAWIVRWTDDDASPEAETSPAGQTSRPGQTGSRPELEPTVATAMQVAEASLWSHISFTWGGNSAASPQLLTDLAVNWQTELEVDTPLCQNLPPAQAISARQALLACYGSGAEHG